MNYIVFDLEMNQKLPTDQPDAAKKVSYPYEIIQIGAIKLASEWNTAAEFNRFIRPVIYPEISPFITELTGITTQQLIYEAAFPEVFQDFLTFTGSTDAVLVSWGKTDIRELFRSADYFQLDHSLLPRQYIDIQPYASLHLKQPNKKLLRLQYVVEALNIAKPYPFHNAFHDAWYTAEIFKKIMNPGIQPKLYDPSCKKTDLRPRLPRRTIDFDAVISQFEKMYQRPMTEEEKAIIKLSYQMGKTGQFIK